MFDKKSKFLIGGGLLVAIFLFYELFFGAKELKAKTSVFVVPLNGGQSDIASKLESEGFLRSRWGVDLIFFIRGLSGKIEPGGYYLSPSMNVWEIAGVLKGEPYLKWVVIPEGWRKEQIAELLSKTLGWNSETKNDWVTKFTAETKNETEGVYFPDTYLVPKNEEPEKIAERLRSRFQEKFASLSAKTLKENIKWDTLVKVASLVQREAAGKDDMPLIAGIIWNRLLEKMKLDIDATVQYARDTALSYGSDGENYLGFEEWWKPVVSKDKSIKSPFNTYAVGGLPPSPIGNPGLDALEAALHPAKTDCLYYLHGKNRETHCARTYEEHQANIRKYLK